MNNKNNQYIDEVEEEYENELSTKKVNQFNSLNAIII